MSKQAKQLYLLPTPVATSPETQNPKAVQSPTTYDEGTGRWRGRERAIGRAQGLETHTVVILSLLTRLSRGPMATQRCWKDETERQEDVKRADAATAG